MLNIDTIIRQKLIFFTSIALLCFPLVTLHAWNMVVYNHTPYDLNFLAHFVGASRDIRGGEFMIPAGSLAAKSAGLADLTGWVSVRTVNTNLGICDNASVDYLTLNGDNAKGYGWNIGSGARVKLALNRDISGNYRVADLTNKKVSVRGLSATNFFGEGQSIWHTFHVYLVYVKNSNSTWREELVILNRP